MNITNFYKAREILAGLDLILLEPFTLTSSVDKSGHTVTRVKVTYPIGQVITPDCFGEDIYDGLTNINVYQAPTGSLLGWLNAQNVNTATIVITHCTLQEDAPQLKYAAIYSYRANQFIVTYYTESRVTTKGKKSGLILQVDDHEELTLLTV